MDIFFKLIEKFKIMIMEKLCMMKNGLRINKIVLFHMNTITVSWKFAIVRELLLRFFLQLIKLENAEYLK